MPRGLMFLAIALACEGKAATTRCTPNGSTHGGLVFQPSFRQVGDGKVVIVVKQVEVRCKGRVERDVLKSSYERAPVCLRIC